MAADADIPTKNLWDREPALIVAAITAVLTAAAPFLHLDAGVIAGIDAAIVAVAGAITRGRVTPV
jgi:hypothetical protein